MTDATSAAELPQLASSRCDNTPAFSATSVRVMWVLYVLLLAWYMSGAFPVGASQGDAFQEAAGVEHIARYGWGEPLLTHNFVGCPGLTWTLLLLRKLTGIAPLALICYLCAVSGLIYLLAGAGLVQRLTRLPFPLAGMVVLLSPVAIIAGAYGNDMVTSSALAILAMYFFAGRITPITLFAGAVSLGLAGLFRADAVLITPAIPFLLYRGDLGKTLRQVILAGLVSATVAIGLVYLCGSNVAAIVSHARAVASDMGRTLQIVGFYVSFFPLLIVYLFVIGLIALVKDKQWRMLAVFIAGVAPLWLIHLTFPLPKYFTHVVPFFAIVCSYALGSVLRLPASRGRSLRLALVCVLFVGQYLLGLQVVLRDKPWRAPPKPTPVVVLDHDFPTGRLSYAALVVGPGTLNPFGHSGTPVSGIFFTPLNLRHNHIVTRAGLEDAVEYVRDAQAHRLVFFANAHDGVQAAVYALVNNGYRCLLRARMPWPNSFRYDWVNGERTAVIYRMENADYDMRDFRSLGELSCVYMVSTGREELAVKEQSTSARLVSRHHGRDVRAIYEVTFPPLPDEPQN